MKSFIQSEEELQRGGESEMLADPPSLDNAGLFHCESITLSDCYYPQTILAYELNGAPLDVLTHGVPLRLRFEQHLGYKQANYVMRIELVESPLR